MPELQDPRPGLREAGPTCPSCRDFRLSHFCNANREGVHEAVGMCRRHGTGVGARIGCNAHTPREREGGERDE